MVKVEASSKKTAQVSHQGNKIRELKAIQCTIKVSFQDQRNPQNCKNPSKITSCTAQDFLVNYI